MKETKEIEEDYIEKILKFDSKLEAEDFNKIANGRKFCKIGERLTDIYDQEIEKYNYENSKNILKKILKRKKYKKQKLLLENRPTSTIRGITSYIIKEEKNQNKDEVIKEVKEIILKKVKEYKKGLK